MGAIAPIHLHTSRRSENDFRDLCDATFEYIIEISPVRTGFFQSQWEMDYDYPECWFTNPTEYGEYIEEGISSQAPNGIHAPVREFVANYIG